MARLHPDHRPPVALLTLRLLWEVAEGSGREAVAQERTPQQLSVTELLEPRVYWKHHGHRSVVRVVRGQWRKLPFY